MIYIATFPDIYGRYYINFTTVVPRDPNKDKLYIEQGTVEIRTKAWAPPQRGYTSKLRFCKVLFGTELFA